ncbi:hypothetical protein BCR35DRAFT_332369 [Leucosporidium creatinivorum]|uniref:Magnesium transporter n=1 Tax=Leucosporidium creatinivorum TaxID=106004 RepID=A0A1Y2F2B5_9BASI|nr:hypothetical protein BCR35DRAFT_332369 [Leucosporidium creatinivorum]
MPIRSVLDLFTGIRATPTAQLPAPEDGGSSQLLRRELKAMERKAKAEGGGLFSKFMKGKSAVPMDYEEVMRRRNSEMEKALERTLGGGRRGVPASGASGMEIRCTTLDEKGSVTTTARQYSKLELCTRYGIQPRDLRKLDSGVPTVVPTILVRRSCIILTILHLRVVITAKEVTLFDSIGSEDSWLKGIFLYHLQHALKTNTKAAHGLPYEFRALESCLISVTTALETELVNVRALVLDLLQELESHIVRDKLRLLLQYSRKLAVFQKRATLVQECLEEVLENDDDLAAMYLTEKITLQHPRSSDDHEEVELLLESFSKQTEEIVSEVETLSANVRSTEDIIELILDANRNSLLGLDLKVSIATLGLTSGALIAGLFGMNVSFRIARSAVTLSSSLTLPSPQLSTRLEDHPFAFPVVTVASFALAGAVTLFGLRRLRQMRRVALGWRAGDAMRVEGERWGNSARKRVRSPRR